MTDDVPIHHHAISHNPFEDQRAAARWAWEVLTQLAKMFCQQHCLKKAGFPCSCSEGAKAQNHAHAVLWTLTQKKLHTAFSHLPAIPGVTSCPACAVVKALSRFPTLAEYSREEPVATVHDWHGSVLDAVEITEYLATKNRERSFPCCRLTTYYDLGDVSSDEDQIRELALLHMPMDDLPPMPPPVLAEIKNDLDLGQKVARFIYNLMKPVETPPESNDADPDVDTVSSSESTISPPENSPSKETEMPVTPKYPKETASIPDEELWQIINWNPTSPQDRGRVLFTNRAREVWGYMSDTADNEPSPQWKTWAKREIQSATNDPATGTSYLCRLLRLLESFHCDPIFNKSGMERNALHATFMSGLAASGLDMRVDHSRLFDYAMSSARSRGLVMIEDVDEWHSGMKSGSGHRDYIRLTVAGKRFAASTDKRQPPEPYPATDDDATSEEDGSVESIPVVPLPDAGNDRIEPHESPKPVTIAKAFVSSRTRTELYRYMKGNGGSYNELRICFQNCGIEPDEHAKSTSTTNKDRFLDSYILPLDLTKREDADRLMEFLAQAVEFRGPDGQVNPNAKSLYENVIRDGWCYDGSGFVFGAPLSTDSDAVIATPPSPATESDPQQRIVKSTAINPGAPVAHAEAKTEIHLHVNVSPGAQAHITSGNAPVIPAVSDEQSGKDPAQAPSGRNLGFDKCLLQIDPISQTVALYQAFGKKPIKQLGMVVTQKQRKKFEFILGAMGNSGAMTSGDKDTARQIRDSIRDVFETQGVQWSGDPVVNQGKDQYRIDIPIRQKPDDYQSEDHQNIEDFAAMDAQGQVHHR